MHKRFTDQAHRAVVLAPDEARMRGRDHAGTEHLLLGLIDEAGVAAAELEPLGRSLEAVCQQAAGQMSGRRQHGRPAARVPFTARARNEPELSLRQALRRDDNHIGAGHILLALIDEPGAAGAEVWSG